MGRSISEGEVVMKATNVLLPLSIVTRLGVVLLLCFFAMMTEYLNYKTAYNNPRLVELASGKSVRVFYEATDAIFDFLGDPIEVAQSNGGMTWSIRVLGVPFTDPVAAISVFAKGGSWTWGFVLGLAVPVSLALIFGRVFCAYVCPASLAFYTMFRIRHVLEKWFLLPDLKLNRGFAWGVLIGGTGAAIWAGHGVWSLILPYFAVGQTLFHGIAMGTLSISLGSIVFFALLDLFFGPQFTCRYVCPTGRLLGFIGRRSLVSVRRDANRCIDQCNTCAEVCPMNVSPKLDQTVDCSLCGACLTMCPSNCLSVGNRGEK
jgi:ferredoxin-type protein NapH